MSQGRPTLGKIKVGDTVYVRSHWSYHDYVGVVTKVGRVWVTVKRNPDGWAEDRFRMDTQTDGSGTSAASRFETPAQYAWTEREEAASKYLRERGLTVDAGPWTTRRLELANLLRRHEGLEEL